MHLAFLSVTDYRGIRSLRLPIGPTTTLIGENAYGKSNLLDALLVCIGVGTAGAEMTFLPGDFRGESENGLDGTDGDDDGPRRPRPIEIDLGFRESSEGEWDSDPELAALRSRVYRGPRGDRRITFRTRATLRRQGDRSAVIDVEHSFVEGTGDRLGEAATRDDLLLLRRKVPFLLVKADRYFVRPSRLPPSGHGGATARSSSIEDRLAEEVGHSFAHVADLHRPIDGDTLRRGVEAAESYVERFGGDRLRRRLGQFLSPSGAGGTGLSSGVRSMALMLVLGSILDAKAESTFGPGANPVLAIEDAEAYLHPTVLASVATIIQAIPSQKLITTNSGELLSMLPIESIRRLVPGRDRTRVFRLGRDSLRSDEARRVGYHVRANRGSSLFARCWLLVEGETEFWLLPEFAALAGFNFALEGVRCMEFAQCGIPPLIKLADDLGIAWHLLADGDPSGDSYAETARTLLRGRPAADHVTQIRERDIEHLLWRSGYADTYRSAIKSAAPRRFDRRPRVDNPTPTIERALRARTKPGMALEVVEAAEQPGSPGIPETLRAAIERTVTLARAAAS